LIEQATHKQHVIVFPYVFLGLLEGQHNSCILLNQCLYWSSRTSDPEGWFYKTYNQWKQETGLSRYQVNRAIDGDPRVENPKIMLRELGIETKVKKAPNGNPTVHYRVNMPVFFAYLVDYLERQCGHPIGDTVTERSATMSQMEMQHCNTPSLTENIPGKNSESQSPPAPYAPEQPAGVPEDDDIPEILAPGEKLFGKIPVSLKKGLINEATRLSAAQIEKTLERCVQYRARSWYYVLTALQNEIQTAEVAASENSDNAFDWDAYYAECEMIRREKEEKARQRQAEIVVKAVVHEICQSTVLFKYSYAECWQKACRQLQLQLDGWVFGYWIEPLILVDVEVESNTFVFVTEDEASKSKLGLLYRNIRRVLSDVVNKKVELRFYTREEWKAHTMKTATA
jgi:hypothetical protein